MSSWFTRRRGVRGRHRRSDHATHWQGGFIMGGREYCSCGAVVSFTAAGRRAILGGTL
jgi:hypothetical protein